MGFLGLVENKRGVSPLLKSSAMMCVALMGAQGCIPTGSESDRESESASGGEQVGTVRQRLEAFVTLPGTVRLLTKKQYLRSIGDLLGSAARDAATPVAWSGPDGGNFVATAAIDQSVGTLGAVLALGRAADAAAAAAVATRTNTSLPLAGFDGCTTLATPTANERTDCYRRLSNALGRVAFRVPLLPEQVELLIDVGQSAEASPNPGESAFDAGLREVAATLLQSPSFIYSFELGAGPNTAGARTLLPHQLATRLALTLLGRGPSLALLETAANGGLDSAAEVRATAQAMLATPQAQEAYWDIVEEWFLIDQLDQKDRPSFPQFNQQLREDMKEEARRYAVNVAFGPTPIPFPQLLSSQQRFINQRLADNIYTQAPITVSPGADGWQLVDFNNHHNQLRAGMLTMPAFLAVLASDQRTKIVARGKFTWERVLCGEVIPPPPAGVGMFPDPLPGETWRDVLSRHATDPACAACHLIFDPGGYALENFDQIGAYRTNDPGAGNGVINAATTVIHPNDNSAQIDILDGLDYGKLMANPSFPNSNLFIENTAACQWSQLHEALLGIPMQGESFAGGGLTLDDTAELAALKAATPGYPQFFLKDFLTEIAASPYFMSVDAPR